MCGFCGFIGGESEATLQAMTATMAHRGPDDAGTWLSPPLAGGARVGLGSRRLAILDLSPAGHMPMWSADGTVVIAYNGEIYNYPALRRELEGRGHVFRSGSDTEAILHLYQAVGVDCVKRLNGMFAFALWDTRAQRLLLARDHFGVKPLYVVERPEGPVFGSEIKALLRVPAMRRELDWQALDQYLTFLWVPEPATMLAGVRKLPAGHRAVWERGQLRIEPFWDLVFPAAGDVPPADDVAVARELRERFAAAVESQLLSDVPLAAFLSAGLDSSAIVAAMAHRGHRTRTFTITFPERYRRGEVTLDDTAVAARTAATFGTTHEELLVEPDVLSLLPKLVWHMDDPVADPAIVTAYVVCRAARQHATVLLSGIGGDELFAGYRKHQAHALAQRYQRIPAVLRRDLLEPAIRALPSFRGTAVKGWVRLAKKMARSGSLPPVDRILMDSTYHDRTERRRLLTAEAAARIGDADAWAVHRELFARVVHADFLNQMLYVDSKAFMPGLNLLYNDKMSMASSVEVRVPFLDVELAEWVATHVPPSQKLHHGTTKHILREAMRPWLPPEVLRQRKAGFGAPADYWLAHDLRELVDDLLAPDVVRRRGLLDPAEVRRRVDEQRSGAQDWSLQIWQFLTLELWCRTFLDRDGAAPLS